MQCCIFLRAWPIAATAPADSQAHAHSDAWLTLAHGRVAQAAQVLLFSHLPVPGQGARSKLLLHHRTPVLSNLAWVAGCCFSERPF